MIEPSLLVGIRLFHFFDVIQAFDDFRDIQSRLHIQIDERIVRIIEISLIFVCEQIDYFFNDFFGIPLQLQRQKCAMQIRRLLDRSVILSAA